MKLFNKKQKSDKSTDKKISEIPFNQILEEMSIGDEIYWIRYLSDRVATSNIIKCKIVGVGYGYRYVSSNELYWYIDVVSCNSHDSKSETTTVYRDRAERMFKSKADAIAYYEQWLLEQYNKEIDETVNRHKEKYEESVSKLLQMKEA